MWASPATRRSAGTSASHRPGTRAKRQRGWKTQPDGFRIKDGANFVTVESVTTPLVFISRRWRAMARLRRNEITHKNSLARKDLA